MFCKTHAPCFPVVRSVKFRDGALVIWTPWPLCQLTCNTLNLEHHCRTSAARRCSQSFLFQVGRKRLGSCCKIFCARRAHHQLQTTHNAKLLGVETTSSCHFWKSTTQKSFVQRPSNTSLSGWHSCLSSQLAFWQTSHGCSRKQHQHERHRKRSNGWKLQIYSDIQCIARTTAAYLKRYPKEGSLAMKNASGGHGSPAKRNRTNVAPHKGISTASHISSFSLQLSQLRHQIPR